MRKHLLTGYVVKVESFNCVCFEFRILIADPINLVPEVQAHTQGEDHAPSVT